MANKKITELDAITTLASTDVVPVVDVSADTTNKITTTNLFRTLPDGTAAAPALAFSSDQANGVYLAGTDTVGISTGGTQRVTVDGSGNVSISGDLTVSGATTTVESTTVTIDDKNIELGSVASPSNTTADGGGITLKGATDKTLKWINSTGCWTFNQPMNFNDHVRIDSSGNVGIGTSSPVANTPLTLQGPSGYTDTLWLKSTGTNIDSRINFGPTGTGNAQINNATGTDIAFQVSGSEKLRIDSSGRIGIGTSSPGSFNSTGDDLVVSSSGATGITINAGTSDSSNVYFADSGNSTQGQIRYFHSSDSMSFGVNGSDAVRINSSGDVGIGTSSPENNLHIADTSGPIIRLSNSTGTDGSYIGRIQTGDAAGTFFAGINFFKHDTNDGEIRFRTKVANTNQDTVTIVDGRVGIGTTSPGHNLEVKGSFPDFAIVDSDTTNDKFRILHNGGGTQLMVDPNNVGPNASYFLVSVDGSERMRIDSSGRLLLGTTTEGIEGANNLTIADSGHAGITIRSGTTSAGAIYFSDATSGNAEFDGFVQYDQNTRHLRFGTAQSERARIDSSGNVGIGTTSPDQKLHIVGNYKGVNSSGQGVQIVNTATPYIQSLGTSTINDLMVSSKTFRVETGTSYATSERLRIDSSGRLLVGASSEFGTASRNSFYSLFQIKGNTSGASSDGRIALGTGATTGSNTSLGTIIFNDTDGGDRAFIRGYSASAGGSGNYPGHLTFWTNAGAANPTERLRITSTGAWAIEGASNYGTSGQVLTSNGNDSPTWQDAAGGGGATDSISEGNTSVECVDTGSNGHITFDTEGSERMRIDSSGKVGIGTASPDSNSLLTVNGVINLPDDVAIAWGGGTNRSSWSGNKASGFLRAYTNGSERMRIDSSGRVGIGASTMYQPFEVNFTDAATSFGGVGNGGDWGAGSRGILIENETNTVGAKALVQYRVGDADCFAGIQRAGTNAASFIFQREDNSPDLIIDSNGRVGIGDTSPSMPLAVQGTNDTTFNNLVTTASFSGTQSYDSGNAGGGILLAGKYNSSGAITTFGVISAVKEDSSNDGEVSGSLRFGVRNQYTGLAIERMRLSSTGNLGIGTTSPSEKLDVSGNAKASHILSDGNFIGRGNLSGSDARSGVTTIGPASDTTPRAFMGAYAEFYGGAHSSKAGELKLGTGQNTAGPIIFELNTNEEARFNSSGVFLHGKTSQGYNTNGVEITHNGGGNANVSVTNDNLCIRVNRITSNGEVIQMMKSGTIVGRIQVSGSSTAYNTTSDYRVKENVVNLTGAINRVKQLAPKRFNFIVEPDETVDGFLAHEAQTVVPEAVSGTHNGVEVWKEGEELPDGVSVGDNKLDEDGNTIPEHQGIDQSKLVPLLTAALQEAIAKIETLETKVAALEAQ